MKALRRSIKGDKDKDKDRERNGQNVSNPAAVQKLAVAIMPPKKVIRATDSFQARSPLELSFEEGDFFHVIDREEAPDFYEACNPALPDARGYVPVALFQILGRTGKETEPAVRRPRPSLPPPINTPLGSGNGLAMATSAAAANIKRPSIPIGAPISMPMSPHQRSGSLSKNGPMVYGIVMYSFAAERADELEAKAGEAIIVIAQSNPEWFVAKPIGRLGGPGLIPVSFVEIRDMVTGQAIADPEAAIRQAGVPRVEEWKQMAADYKNSSITLGKFDVGAAPQSTYADQQAQDMQQAISRLSLQQQQQLQQPSAEVIESQKREQEKQGGQGQQSRQQSIDDQRGSPGERQDQNQYRSQQQPPQKHMQQRSRDQLQQPQQPQQQRQPRYADGPNPDYVNDPNAAQDTIDPSAIKDLYAPISARVPRYCFAEDKYWFVIEVVLEDGKPWELARYYEDFYDFQIALLNEFPSDAGNTGDNKRTLPYMPGPVSYVTDAITEGRMHNLDSYVKNLLSQPERIARSSLVKQFFAPREGDCEMDPNRRQQDYDTQGQNQRQEDFGGPLLSATVYVPPGQEGGEGGDPMTERQKQKAPANHPDVPIKIKLYFNGDLIAMRLPGDVNFRGLVDRIRQRLRLTERDQLELFYKDEPTGNKPDLISDNDLNYALQRNEKLMLYAEVV